MYNSRPYATIVCYWASNCDWINGDFQNVSSTASNCGPTSAATIGCTNFACNNYVGGTCWMKKGSFPKSAAVYSSSTGSVCGGVGVIASSTSSIPSPTSSGSPTSTTEPSTTSGLPTTTPTMAPALEGDRRTLLQNVTTSTWTSVAPPQSILGAISIFSDQVAPLLVDSSSRHKAYIAHGRAGLGKFIAAAHNDLFSFDLAKIPQLAQFWKNSLWWGRAAAPKVGCFPNTQSSVCPKVAYSIQMNSSFYSISGPVTQFSKDDLKQNSKALSAVDVLYVDALKIGLDSLENPLDADTSFYVSALRSWLESGGTIVAVAIDWKMLDSLPIFKNDLQQIVQTVCTNGVNWTVLPITKEDYRRRNCTGLQYGLRNSSPFASQSLLQSASNFPGVPQAAVPRTTKTGAFTTAFTKWISTRLYVTAGTTVSVRFCPSSPADLTSIAGVQYSSDWIIEGGCKSLNVTSYFGGLLYFDVVKAGSLGNVTVSGNLAAVPFYDGSQTLDQWRSSLTSSQAFYAELDFNGITLSYPINIMRKEPCASQPDAIKAFFDQVIEALIPTLAFLLTFDPNENKLLPRYFDLSGENSRPYKERFNIDEDIGSGGYHAGYSIQGVEANATKLCIMHKSIYETDAFNMPRDFSEPQGDLTFWSFVHEIGHNFQQRPWATIAMEGNSENADNFVKLRFYVDLRYSFGYEAFRRVFRAYLNMTSPPTIEQDQIDVWAKTFSQTVGCLGRPAAIPRTYNSSTVLPCTAAATPFAFGLSPCASVAASSDRLVIKLSPWATLRNLTLLAVELTGSGIPSFLTPGAAAVNTTVPLTGDSAALFGGCAGYAESAAVPAAAVLYLRPVSVVPFDTPITLSADFSKAKTKLALGGVIRTTYWMETAADGQLFMIDKRSGADVTY
ncbi:hypothetical protein DFJ73DRAFT_922862 [Zopfochytrium polystomum]|nr:hypothetical protein DFJ73DRAFT_922862 [Zopfochytrium polystomum]